MLRENGVVVVKLEGKEFPRAKNGDVKFNSLEEIQCLFTEIEITTLVNRALYHMEYQKAHHKVYSQKQRDLEAPVKAAAKRLFPSIAWINLTPSQHRAAMDLAFSGVGKSVESAESSEEGEIS